MSVDQSFHLTPDDDLASLRERLRRTQAQTVILVVPNDVAVLRNAVNVRLLQRYASQTDTRLFIVTRDRTTEDLARRQGLKVYGALERIPPKSRGGVTKEDMAGVAGLPRVPFYRHIAKMGCWTIALVIVAAAVAALVLAAVAAAPSATITLVPAAEPVPVTLNLLSSTQIRVIDSAKGQFPARPAQVLIEDTGQAETTGVKRVPDAEATGTIVFANRSLGALTIPKGTVVRTATGVSIRFRTEADAALPAGAFSTVRVPIKAVEPGLTGNVKAGAISIVEGTFFNQVNVLNDVDTSGGTVKEVRYVTLQDRNNLRDAIIQKMRARSYSELGKAFAADDIVPAETLTLVVNETSFDKPADAEGVYVTGKVRATVSGFVLAGDDIKKLVAARVRDQVKPGFVVLPEAVSYGAPTNVKYSDGVISFQISATARSRAAINEMDVQRAAAGKPRAVAVLDIDQMFSLAAAPEIELQWGWLGRMPLFTSRIKVIIQD